MPKIDKITMTYEEKRSGNFQSAGHSLTVEIILEEGDVPQKVIAEYQLALKNKVSEFTREQIEQLVSDAQGGNGR